jgi:hypothetical protein
METYGNTEIHVFFDLGISWRRMVSFFSGSFAPRKEP